jgi:hydrogenase expression/formation protein HypC
MCLAVPGKLLETQSIGENRLGIVQFGETSRQVFLDFIPDAQAGDYVLVHAGFAINRLSEEEARQTSELLDHLGIVTQQAVGPESEAAVTSDGRQDAIAH